MINIENNGEGHGNAINGAKIAHGAAQLIRGAVSGDWISIASGASKVVRPEVIAVVAVLFVILILLPVIILASLPQVLFNWGSSKNLDLQSHKAYADYLKSCYESAEGLKQGEIENILAGLNRHDGVMPSEVDGTETDILWLIAIDSVRSKQNISAMNASEIQSSIRRSLMVRENTDENGGVRSVTVKNKDPDAIMTELGFSDDEKNWARLLYSTVTYGQYLDPNSDYADAGRQEDYDGMALGEGSTEVIYFNQLDARWKDKLYGRAGTIGNEGCGPTAVAIAASTLTGKTITPVGVAKWSADNGHRCVGSGSYHSLIPAAAKHYGLKVESLGNSTAQQLGDHLSQGKLIIALMKKGHFTSSGHFIVLRGITSENKILVADPSSYTRSNQEWDISIILNESSKGAGAGGPFWCISR